MKRTTEEEVEKLRGRIHFLKQSDSNSLISKLDQFQKLQLITLSSLIANPDQFDASSFHLVGILTWDPSCYCFTLSDSTAKIAVIASELDAGSIDSVVLCRNWSFVGRSVSLCEYIEVKNLIPLEKFKNPLTLQFQELDYFPNLDDENFKILWKDRGKQNVMEFSVHGYISSISPLVVTQKNKSYFFIQIANQKRTTEDEIQFISAFFEGSEGWLLDVLCLGDLVVLRQFKKTSVQLSGCSEANSFCTTTAHSIIQKIPQNEQQKIDSSGIRKSSHYENLYDYLGVITRKFSFFLYELDDKYILIIKNSVFDIRRTLGLRAGTTIQLRNIHLIQTNQKIQGFGCCFQSHISIVQFSLYPPTKIEEDNLDKLFPLFKKLSLSDSLWLFNIYQIIQSNIPNLKDTQIKEFLSRLINTFKIDHHVPSIPKEISNHDHCSFNSPNTNNKGPVLCPVAELPSCILKHLSGSHNTNSPLISSIHSSSLDIPIMVMGRLKQIAHPNSNLKALLMDKSGSIPILISEGLYLSDIEEWCVITDFHFIIDELIGFIDKNLHYILKINALHNTNNSNFLMSTIKTIPQDSLRIKVIKKHHQALLCGSSKVTCRLECKRITGQQGEGDNLEIFLLGASSDAYHFIREGHCYAIPKPYDLMTCPQAGDCPFSAEEHLVVNHGNLQEMSVKCMEGSLLGVSLGGEGKVDGCEGREDGESVRSVLFGKRSHYPKTISFRAQIIERTLFHSQADGVNTKIKKIVLKVRDLEYEDTIVVHFEGYLLTVPWGIQMGDWVELRDIRITVSAREEFYCTFTADSSLSIIPKTPQTVEPLKELHLINFYQKETMDLRSHTISTQILKISALEIFWQCRNCHAVLQGDGCEKCEGLGARWEGPGVMRTKLTVIAEDGSASAYLEFGEELAWGLLNLGREIEEMVIQVAGLNGKLKYFKEKLFDRDKEIKNNQIKQIIQNASLQHHITATARSSSFTNKTQRKSFYVGNGNSEQMVVPVMPTLRILSYSTTKSILKSHQLLQQLKQNKTQT